MAVYFLVEVIDVLFDLKREHSVPLIDKRVSRLASLFAKRANECAG